MSFDKCTWSHNYHHLQIFHAPLYSPLLPTSSFWQQLVFFTSIVLSFIEYYINEIIQYAAFYIWLLFLFTIIYLKFNHVIAYISSLHVVVHFSIAEQYSVVWIYHFFCCLFGFLIQWRDIWVVACFFCNYG